MYVALNGYNVVDKLIMTSTLSSPIHSLRSKNIGDNDAQSLAEGTCLRTVPTWSHWSKFTMVLVRPRAL